LGRREGRFATIYAENYWGKAAGEPYFSGFGSLSDNLAPYADFASQYIRMNRIRSVVDMGCGDFRASRSIDLNGASYLGVDIVSDLVRYNQQRFGSAHIRFMRLDATRDALPPGELCLLKAVLQHWSNADILALLPKLSIYEHVLVLNGYVAALATPGCNQEHKTGASVRFGGLYLEAAPFHCDVEPLLMYRSVDEKEEYRLVRYHARAR
jgi:hypothetical protein